MPTAVYRVRSLPRLGNRRLRRIAFGKLNPLVAGTASFVSSGPGGISVTATDASGGTSPYTYQWQRSLTSGSGFSNLSGATSLSHTDTTASAGTLYYYRIVYTDNASQTATSSQEPSAQIYSGGALGSGGMSRARIVNAGGN